MMERIDSGMTEQVETERPDSSKTVARIVMLAIVIGAILIGWRYFGPKHALGEAGWNYDWDAAVAQSRSTGKPALVLFTADWCPACRQFESQVLGDPDVQQSLKASYTLVVVDLSKRANRENNERARACAVRAIPTLILYDTEGLERARTHGMPGEALMRWLRSNG